ncbi:hypothetical protein [Celeribacter baekdonensis]|uniref:hypothetical protein n=1 Tax=Celeribacter baekdonensis TaxID=875171 RepID=UPI0030DCE34A|tara:strand:+ start:364616 stop:364882 length:267 start_codon:yes stop_codon:yes gene_type:complete
MTAAAPIRETRNIQAQTALPSAPPDLLLKGISENGEMRKALIGTESAEIEMEWQKIGTRFDDWELIEIGSDWILIENNEDQIRVDMYK